MLFRFKPMYPVSLTKLNFSLIWLMDYISKCDNVVLAVIRKIAFSKTKLILSSKSEITRLI